MQCWDNRFKFTKPLFIQVSVPSQESQRSRICVLWYQFCLLLRYVYWIMKMFQRCGNFLVEFYPNTMFLLITLNTLTISHAHLTTLCMPRIDTCSHSLEYDLILTLTDLLQNDKKTLSNGRQLHINRYLKMSVLCSVKNVASLFLIKEIPYKQKQ